MVHRFTPWASQSTKGELICGDCVPPMSEKLNCRNSRSVLFEN
jgi:hypothetical protein